MYRQFTDLRNVVYRTQFFLNFRIVRYVKCLQVGLFKQYFKVYLFSQAVYATAISTETRVYEY
jgi:hypothetical protein